MVVLRPVGIVGAVDTIKRKSITVRCESVVEYIKLIKDLIIGDVGKSIIMPDYVERRRYYNHFGSSVTLLVFIALFYTIPNAFRQLMTG